MRLHLHLLKIYYTIFCQLPHMHDFLPTSTHAHNYITRSLDSLHPNEQVYMHFNIKRVEKVVLRRKKAKMGKTHCFTCLKMRLHLR